MESSPYELNQQLKVAQLLHQSHTGRQQLLIFQSPMLGRVMVLDGLIQTTERDEFVYHELLVHPPLFAHGNVKHVLIIGGGDGGALRTALQHPIEQATLVEIDGTVVDLARKYLQPICGDAFDDPRSQLLITDGARFVAETDQRFDVIIVDSTDPVGTAQILFTSQFYGNCHRCLRPGGILITQSGVPFVQHEQLQRCAAALRARFADATFYMGAVPTYNGGPMAFGWASDQPTHRHHDADLLRVRYAQAGIRTRYYNPDVHLAAFALPNYVRELLPA